VSEFGVHVVYLKIWPNTQCHVAAMPKNIFDSNTCTRNTTSRDVCDWLCLTIEQTELLLHYGAINPLPLLPVYWTALWVTEKCLWNPNSTNSCRNSFLSTECVLWGSDWSTLLRSFWHIALHM